MRERCIFTGFICLLLLGAGFVIMSLGAINALGSDVSGVVYDGFGGPWTQAGSPYVVTADVIVPAGQTLTIEPGTVVKFESNSSLYVEGNLFSVGSETNRITITSNKSTPQPSDWRRLQVNSTGHAQIRYCDISYGLHGIILEGASGNNITENTISEMGLCAIELQSSSLNNISNNYIFNIWEYGVRLESSSDGNLVSNNTIINTSYAVQTYLSDRNIIIDNDFTLNVIDLMVTSSTNNTLSRNVMVGGGIHINGPLLEQWNNHDIGTSNTLNGKPVYFLKDQNGGTVPEGGGQVILANCTGVRVEGHEFSGTYIGLQLGFSSNNVITGNNLSDNINGLDIRFSDGNEISNNTISSNAFQGIFLQESGSNSILANIISDNNYGLIMRDSDGNMIYHNDFIGNMEQAGQNSINQWDNGYPSGGNYWSDYDGGDDFSGPDQNEPGADGRGDGPYSVLLGGADRYPLMGSIIGNTDPIASFTISPSTGNVSLDFKFNASSCSDLQDSIDDLKVRWDWENDGIWDTVRSSEKSASHRFSSPVTYTVRLEVMDKVGFTDNFTQQVVVYLDSDGDGYKDGDDAFPDDPNEWVDTDFDGFGDNGDAFPTDPTEWADTDGDGTGDNSDAFPDDPGEWKDSDSDGYGDNSDAFPSDPAEWIDTDLDGYGNNTDAFPEDPTEWADTDGDGTGDNSDAFPEDPGEWLDSDGDGVGDNSDAFPDNPGEWEDSDNDGIGDVSDPFPEDSTEWLDTDGDGRGDNTDLFPNDPDKWEEPSFQFGTPAVLGALIAIMLGSVYIGGTEIGRYRVVPLLYPLYTRIKREEVLDQFTRGRIYEHIRKNPGDHYSNIRDELELNNGVLAYHLKTLEREDYVTSMRDGIYKRFYPIGMSIPRHLKKRLSPIQKEIIQTIRKNPGASQKEISNSLNISQQVVSYHVNLTIQSGLLRSEKQDNALRYFVED